MSYPDLENALNKFLILDIEDNIKATLLSTFVEQCNSAIKILLGQGIMSSQHMIACITEMIEGED